MLLARVAYNDGVLAVEYLESATDDAHFRLFWITCCASLRAIGHVLHNVDAAMGTQELRDAINVSWQSWKAERNDHPIFWEFIEQERNLMLKAYDVGYSRQGSTMIVPDDTAGEWVSELVSSDLYTPMRRGCYSGHDARDLVREALQWWDRQLNILEAMSSRADG